MPDLEIRDCSVFGNDGACILHVPELGLQSGRSLGVRGPSGAGKSTLLYLLAGLQANVSGAARWGDLDLVRAGAGELTAFRRQSLGMIFQESHLFEELGPLDNAALCAGFAPKGERRPIQARAAAGLRRMGLAPDRGRVGNFSGGERQRIAVARALAGNPSIILADEPTASLDRETADALIDDLVAVVREEGASLVAVSHDPLLLARLDRVIEIADGRLMEEGRVTHAA